MVYLYFLLITNLKVIGKSKGKLIAFKSEKERQPNIEREIKERSKEIMQKLKQRRFRAMTLQGSIENCYRNIRKLKNFNST